MNTKRFFRIGLACCGALLLSAAAAGMQGCVATPVVNEIPRQDPPAANTGGEWKAWEDGMQAFREGDYGKALALFEALSESGENEAIRNRALYGVAVSRLILARTPKEFGEAMSAWDCWSKLPSGGNEGGDPHMMTPFLQSLSPPGGTPESGFPKVRKAPPKDMTTYNNLVACKSLLQTRDKEMERLKARLETREREIRRLRHQIESLENIHLKFQEKKQEVSTP
jgi:hypothetical protein